MNRCWHVLVVSTALRCSIWYGDPPIGQCSVDADCDLPGGDTVCDASLHVCVPAPPPTPSSSEFRDCRPRSAASLDGCAPAECGLLPSEDCTCSSGAWGERDIAVVGVIAPETFGTATGAALPLAYALRLEKMLALGLEEWSRSLPGGRLPVSQRRLALLYCNSNGDAARASRAMQHLTDVIDAPIVITLDDEDTEAIRAQATTGNRAILCATCNAPPAGAVADTLWRVAPALAQQAPLAAARAAELAREVAGGDELTTIVTLVEAYPGLEEFADEVDRLLSVQGYRQVRLQNAEPAAVADARPQVIVAAMDTIFTTYLPAIERSWPEALPRPFYVLTSLNQELNLLDAIIGDDDDLRRRISGTGWFPGSRVDANLESLEVRFRSRYGQRSDQTHYGYDAFYSAAHAMAWADRRAVVSGPGVALGLAHLRSGAPIDVGPDSIPWALTEFGLGQDINLVGSSNLLDWDAEFRATQSDVAVWCVSRNADGSLTVVPSAGPVWHVASGAVTGRFDCPLELIESSLDSPAAER